MDKSFVFVDDYDHSDDELEYILENILCEEVKQNETDEAKDLIKLYNSQLLNKCICNQGNIPQCSECSHGANYVFNEEFQELVLTGLRDLIYECSIMCECDRRKCKNRLVQYGPRKNLKIVYSEQYCSKGLITMRDIPKGAYICEYAGELLTTDEAKKIFMKNTAENRMNYLLFLRESCISEKSDDKAILTIVNPSTKGNIGRYLNHSCEPNCHIISVRIDNPVPKIAFFSNRYIKSGEEICFNYNEGVRCNRMEKPLPCERIPCLCYSTNCLKYLPNSE